MFMKKIIIPVIIAAALGVGSAAAVISLNKSADADLPVVTELENGTYYLNGDKSSDVWMEVNSDYLIVKGTDIDASLKDAIASRMHGLSPNETPDENTAAEMQNEFEDCKTLYCTEKVYLVQEFLPEESKSIIKVSRDNTATDPESLEKSNAGFVYNYAKNSINTSLFGDFVLAK